MIRHALTTVALTLLLGLAAAGCGSSSEKKDDPRAEMISRPAEDPPQSSAWSPPPLGKPRSKVSPSGDAHSKDLRASDSFYRDETPH